ncbi:MAG: hypothetical protein OHK003_24600 [Anaerolineales bacterium]
MKNFRDIENLSAYLDGQLSASDAARLEARLKTDPELDSILSDLRAARGILRKLPARKAPRNFTLTRQMVGLKPPMPRAYPLFRLATVFASILFLFSFAATALSPYISFGAPTMGGYGMVGGCDGPCGEAAMEEAPAAAPEESFAQEMVPAEESPSAEIAPFAATEIPSRIMETPSAKEGAPETAPQPEGQQEPSVSSNWTWLFLGITIFGGVVLWVMRLTARNKWR